MRQAPFTQPWPFPVRQGYTGESITLIPTDIERDAAELYTAGHATDTARALWEFMPFGPFDTEMVFSEYLEMLLARPDQIPYTVRLRASGEAVGMLSVMRIVPHDGVAELGSIWYTPTVQRTAVNTEAIYLLLRALFDDFEYRRVEWKCDSRNARSAAAARRLGFTFEGCFRQHIVSKERNRDTLWFSILDHEWPLKQANFERVLYAGDGSSLSALNETPQ